MSCRLFSIGTGTRFTRQLIGDIMKIKNVLCLVLSALTAVSVFSFAASAADNGAADGAELIYYVSPSGSDDAAGTEQAPFATLEKARDTIRASRADGQHATVILRGGSYARSETFRLSAEDGDVTYRAYDGETPIISGLELLDPSRFTAPRDGDPLVARIKSEEARGAVLTYDLSDVRADYIGQAFFFGTERGLKARYPNSGYILGMRGSANDDAPNGKTYYDTENIVSTWDPDSVVGVEVLGNFEIDWSTSEGTIASYDREKNIVTLNTGSWPKIPGRYYYNHVLEELDAVGEYYADSDSKTLYFYAPDGYTEMNMGFVLCSDSIVISEADGVELDGIILEGSGSCALRIAASDNIVKNCIVRFSEAGIKVDGYRNVIDNNDIYHIGATGINVGGGDELLLIPSDSRITNNLIHDFAETKRVYNGALNTTGIGFYIAHNEMHTGPHCALTDAAKDMIFEYNYIHDVCYESGDAGAIYLGGFSCNGGVFRYNIIKDIHNYMSTYYRPNGFYCDDGGSGKVFTSNLIMFIDGDGIAMGRGRDNTITNNIVIDAGFAYDQRGYYPGTGANAGIMQVSAYPDGNWKSLVPWHSPEWGYVNHTPAYGTKTWAYRNAWVMLMKTSNVMDINDNFVPQAFGTLKVNNNILATVSNEDVIGRPDVISYGDRRYNFQNNPVRLGSFRENITTSLSYLKSDVFVDYDGGNYSVREDSNLYEQIPSFRAWDTTLVGRLVSD